MNGLFECLHDCLVNFEHADINIKMGIFTRGYYPYPAGYGYVNNLKPEVWVRVRVWAENIETGTGLGTHYPYPYPAGACHI